MAIDVVPTGMGQNLDGVADWATNQWDMGADTTDIIMGVRRTE
jgi:hypothetical protein